MEMQIVNTLNIDLQNQKTQQRIRVMQADVNTRIVEAHLHNGRETWTVPEDTSAALSYCKPDGTVGFYDKLPDGTAALTVSENIITAILAPQVMTVSGLVLAVIILKDADGNQLSTFPFQIHVEKNPAAGVSVSDHYINAASAIGNLEELTTADKSCLVAAINEVAQKGCRDDDPAAYGLPALYLTGDTTAMSKDNAVSLNYVYGDRSGTASVKWQGSSSLEHPKKNYTIQFDTAFEACEGWGQQKKYCLKANYIDFSHARNIVSAKLWGEVVKSRNTALGFTIGDGVLVPNAAAYTFENGVLTAHFNMLNEGAIFLEGATITEDGGYDITCDVWLPAYASQFIVGVYSHRKDTGEEAFVETSVGAAGVWETVRFNTVWASGSATYVSLFAKTNGAKFRNIRFNGLYGVTSFDFAPIQQIQNLPNGGAIDGFPVCVYLNGQYTGLYTFNIPKDGWLFGMGSGSRECILCANNHSGATRFEEEALCDGSDFEIEYISDEEDTAWAVESVNRLISAVINSDGSDIDSTIRNYVDLESAMDFYIFTALQTGTDCIDKNYLLATYDGIRWFFSAYDMDSTFGNHWTGEKYDSTKSAPNLLYFGHKLMHLLRDYKAAEVKARYEQLRSTAMSEDNVLLEFENFMAGIPSALYEQDTKLWPLIPGTRTNNLAQIANNYRLRVQLLDDQIDQIG